MYLLHTSGYCTLQKLLIDRNCTYLLGGLPPGIACPVGRKEREVEWLGNPILSGLHSIDIPEKFKWHYLLYQWCRNTSVYAATITLTSPHLR